MTDAQSALAQVREALKAGPTRGNWVVAPKMTMPSIVCAVNNVEVCPADHRDPSHQDVDAAYIAAANPANIAAILAHVDAQAAEIERLREMLCKCDMRTRLVGDGCEFCNPQLADELAKEQR